MLTGFMVLCIDGFAELLVNHSTNKSSQFAVLAQKRIKQKAKANAQKLLIYNNTFGLLWLY